MSFLEFLLGDSGSIKRKDFYTVMASGRRKICLLCLRKRPKYLLSLQQLTDHIKPKSETYLGVRQVRVDKIIGTEDRVREFAVSFLPLHQRMSRRWERVRDLFLDGEIEEAIDLIEFGAYYFVRDGNHRVSVAKSHGIDYMDASVIRWNIPVNLLPDMTEDKIPLLKAKLEFYERTRFFDYIPEEKIGDAHPKSWEKLEKSVFERHKKSLSEKLGREPEPSVIIRSWYEGFFAGIMEYIHRMPLEPVFRGLYDLDIYCRVVSLWEEMPENSSILDAYNEYMRNVSRKKSLLVFINLIQRLFNFLTASAEEERERFFRISRLRQIRPRAFIMEGKRKWYRFLIRQLMITHYSYLEQKLDRKPYTDELSGSWYDELYEPALRLYRQENVGQSFIAFYRHWMKSWHRQIVRHMKRRGYVRTISLEESFYRYLEKKRRKRYDKSS